MKLIKPKFEIIEQEPGLEGIYKAIELAGRTCYKSEDKITETSAEDLIKRLIKMNHLSVLEHINISVRFICDRGVSHELVRHRLCSFSQESTRYCNYSGEKFGSELTFIKPCFYSEGDDEYTIWKDCMRESENGYLTGGVKQLRRILYFQ